MTSDGISTEDWDRVHQLAPAIVNEGDTAESDSARAELLAYLDDLEAKYGTLPSIVATRADYVRDVAESVSLLKKAYALAAKREDSVNAVYVASSLTSAYIEARDVPEAEYWLGRLGEALRRAGDESDVQDYQDLEKALRALRTGAGER